MLGAEERARLLAAIKQCFGAEQVSREIASQLLQAADPHWPEVARLSGLPQQRAYEYFAGEYCDQHVFRRIDWPAVRTGIVARLIEEPGRLEELEDSLDHAVLLKLVPERDEYNPRKLQQLCSGLYREIGNLDAAGLRDFLEAQRAQDTAPDGGP